MMLAVSGGQAAHGCRRLRRPIVTDIRKRKPESEQEHDLSGT
jgi:hypothetical protein